MLQVDSKELHSAVKNALLFTKPKTWNGGEVEVAIYGDYTTVSASDDFVSISTTVSSEPDFLIEPNLVPYKVYFDKPTFSGMEKALRTLEGPLNWDISEASPEASEPEWWEGFDKVLIELGDRPVKADIWDLNPERLTLLSRLEPKGEYPLSFRSFAIQEDWLWSFKYGPKTYGLIIPLDRKNIALDEELKKTSLWH